MIRPQQRATIVEVLAERASAQADRPAQRYLRPGADPELLTYAELAGRAGAIAEQLADTCRPGDRVCLMFAPGPHFTAAFFGCLAAGVIAVPAYPPISQADADRLGRILADCQPSAALAQPELLQACRDALGTNDVATTVEWIAATDAAAGSLPVPDDDQTTEIAFLQYTSGTTAQPKGVMVSHPNLMANSAAIADRFGHGSDSVGVIWLPPYHDMGLIGGLLQPVYVGFEVNLLSPLDFVRDPARWLEAISDYRATTSGGPTFAYDLCTRKIPVERMEHVDLSTWQVAFVGADMVRAGVVRRFAERFADHGFDSRAIFPCYGLAESTLIVSGGPRDRDWEVAATSEDPPRTAVGCGQVVPGHDLAIIAPDGKPLPDGDVGEICVRGPSVTSGYWHRAAPAEHRAGDGGAPFRRTGDAGFCREGELYPLGRLADAVVIRGRNYAPDEIETVASGADPALPVGRCVAVSIDVDETTELFVVHEVRDRDPARVAELESAIRTSVVAAFGISPDHVLLVPMGTLTKTTSGKLQRRTVRDRAAAGDLPAIAAIAPEAPSNADSLTAIRQLAAQVLGTEPRRIPDGRPLTAAGLDSVRATQFIAAVHEQLGLELDRAALLDGADCAALAATAAPVAETAVEPTDALTASEYDMWLLQQLAPDSTAYHLCHAVEVDTDLSDAAVDLAVGLLADAHPSLRTVFPTVGGAPVRVVDGPRPVVEHLDASDWDDTAVTGLLQRFAARRLDLATGPLWHVLHIRRGGHRNVLALLTHHACADLWSLTLVAGQLFTALAGTTPAAGGSMASVAQAEQTYRGSASHAADRSRWEQILRNAPEPAELPRDRPRGAVQSFAGAEQRFTVDTDTTTRIHLLAAQTETTPYAVALTSLCWLLHCYTGQQDLLFGMPTAIRASGSGQRVVGMCVNTVPVRVVADPMAGFHQAVERTGRAVRASAAAARYPAADLSRITGDRRRDRSRNSRFDITVGWLDLPGSSAAALAGSGPARFGGLQAQPVLIPVQSTPFDLSIDVAPCAGRLDIRLRYSTDLFDPQTIRRLGTRWIRMLEQLATMPSRRLNSVTLNDNAGQSRVIERTAPPAAPADGTGPLHAGIGAARDLLAVRDRDTTLSYRDLQQRAHALSWQLMDAGVGPEIPVGVLIRRSADCVVAMLAVLGAGGVFVPMDPDNPVQQLATITRDCRPPVILTNGEPVTAALQAALGRHGPAMIAVDTSTNAARTTAPPIPDPQPSNTAYILYTSGTTGTPKGVSVPHRAVVNTLTEFATVAPIASGESVAWWANAAFDVAVVEAFSALRAGGTLQVVPPQVHTDWQRLADWLDTSNVSHSFLPRHAVPALIDHAERRSTAGVPVRLKTVWTGIEPIQLELLQRLQRALPHCRVHNAYGPTETAIFSTITHRPVSAYTGDRAPIGEALRGGPVYLLSSNGRPVPLGVRGEIFIGGIGVSHGYLGSPRTTAEKFLPNPWGRGSRMYRTGDFGRWDNDDALVFLDRVDTQVKLHGVRVELAAVEVVMSRDAAVTGAVATVVGTGDDARLIGHVVTNLPESEHAALSARIRARCLDLLPRSMVPSTVVCLDALPLTANGKLDRGALPVPAPARTIFQPPETTTEADIIRIWRELLGCQEIGRNDDFFDLGGHSMLAARAAMRLSESTGRDIPPALLFSHSTVRSLASALVEQPDVDRIPRLPRRGGGMRNSDVPAAVAATAPDRMEKR